MPHPDDLPLHPLTRRSLSATPEEIAIIEAMVAEGASVIAIANCLGINKQTARRWINAAGFPDYKRPYRHTPEGDAAMLKALSDGQKLTEVAVELGIDVQIIYARLRTLRQRGITAPDGQPYSDPRRRFEHTDQTDQIIRSWTGLGISVTSVAARLGTSRAVVVSRAHALLRDKGSDEK